MTQQVSPRLPWRSFHAALCLHIALDTAEVEAAAFYHTPVARLLTAIGRLVWSFMSNEQASIPDSIRNVLQTPVGTFDADPTLGFEALEQDGTTKAGLSEQVLAAMARQALVHAIPGVVFNDITAHRDQNGQITRIEIDYMDQIHDPSSRRMTVDFS